MQRVVTDKERVQHVLAAIGEVEQYIADVTFDQFLANSEKRFATIKQIEIVGEACHRISGELKQIHTAIVWGTINGWRNIPIPEPAWEIATHDLTPLKQQMRVVLQELA